MVTETSYGLNQKRSIPYEEALPKVNDALKAEGFGVIRLLVNPHEPAGRPTGPGRALDQSVSPQELVPGAD